MPRKRRSKKTGSRKRDNKNANPMPPKRPFPTLWLLLFLSCLAICMQYVTMAKFSVLPPAGTFVTLSAFVQAIEQKIAFEKIDIALLVLFLATCALLLWQERRGQVLTDFLKDVFASERKPVYLLLGCSLICVRFYFAPGAMHWGADASHHIAQSYLAARTIADGQWPIYTFFMGNGSPYLQNYGFAFFCLVGFVELICRDLFFSLKLVMAGTHIISGIGMYFFVGNLCQSRRAGFIAGLGYVLCFWHTQQVLIMGRLPLSLFYALLPWPFYAVESMIRSPYKMRAALIGGASLAFLNFTHPGYGTYAMLFWGCYCIGRLWSLWGRADLGALLRAGVLCMGLGVFFSAYMNAGMYFELEHTEMADFRLGLKGVADEGMSGVPDPTWRHLLGWSNYRFWLLPPEPYHWYGGYLGLSLCALALAGIALFRRDKPWHFAPGWLCLALVVLIVFAYRLPPFNMLSLIQASNAARYLLFLAFFLALSAGIGTRLLLQHRPWRLSRNRCFTLLLLLLLIDLFPTTFLHAYIRPRDRSSDTFTNIWKASAPFTARGELPNYRVQWVDKDNFSYYRMASPLFMSETPISEAFHPAELRTRGAFVAPFLHFARDQAPALTAEPNRIFTDKLLTAGLYLLNTRYVVLSSKNTGFELSLPHSPITVSSRLVGYDAEAAAERAGQIRADMQVDSLLARSISQVRWIIEQMGVRFQDNFCERIFVRDHEGSDLQTTPTAQVISHVVGHKEVKMKVSVSENCYARLSYAHFPYLHITVDGTPVQPLETAGHFIALPLDAGERDIVIQARLSPLRKNLLYLKLILLSIALGLVFIEHKRVNSPNPVTDH